MTKPTDRRNRRAADKVRHMERRARRADKAAKVAFFGGVA